MALPKIDVPIYELILPSNGKKIQFRPFLVKEEKLLLMASLSKDEAEIKRTIKQIINNCFIDKFDVDSAPIFDIEYIMLNLRIKSIGDVVKNQYICNNVIDEATEQTCGNEFNVDIKLNDIEIKKEDVKDEIWLTGNVGVKMRWPRFTTLRKKDAQIGAYDYDIIADCIEYIFDKEQTYKMKEQTKEEVATFFDGLNKEQFDKIVDYLGKVPKFEVHKQATCSKCGYKHDIYIKDLTSFF